MLILDSAIAKSVLTCFAFAIRVKMEEEDQAGVVGSGGRRCYSAPPVAGAPAGEGRVTATSGWSSMVSPR